MNEIEISIVIPVYNSALIIEKLYEQLATSLSEFRTFEIIFVNDCSGDESWKKIKQLVQKNSSITGINLRKNSGQDNALLAGLRAAKGNYVIIMDDDLQHSPTDIIELYNQCKIGYDVCYANFLDLKQSSLKNIGSKLNGKFAELLVQKPKGIYMSPFKILTKSTTAEVSKFAGPYPYIDGIILSITKNITQINLNHSKRLNGKSNYSLSKSVSVFMKLFTGFSVAPLRMATIMGISATFIGFCLMLKYLYDYFFTKNIIEGWTTVVVLIILFGGLILTTLGIIGEYIGRIYLTLNNKPQYSIEEIITSQSDEQ